MGGSKASHRGERRMEGPARPRLGATRWPGASSGSTGSGRSTKKFVIPRDDRGRGDLPLRPVARRPPQGALGRGRGRLERRPARRPRSPCRRPRRATPSRSKKFLPPKGAGAPAPLRPKGTIASLGLWRDMSAIWEVRNDLFPPQVVQGLAQLDTVRRAVFRRARLRLGRARRDRAGLADRRRRAGLRADQARARPKLPAVRAGDRPQARRRRLRPAAQGGLPVVHRPGQHRRGADRRPRRSNWARRRSTASRSPRRTSCAQGRGRARRSRSISGRTTARRSRRWTTTSSSAPASG